MGRKVVIGLAVVVLLPLIGWAAFDTASREASIGAAGQAKWISSHIVPGTSRKDAYAMLRSRGLTAYNWAYEKGKAIPAPSPDPKNPLVGAACDMSDWSSAAWPYQNEPLPKLEGACASGTPTKPIRNPKADIDLDGEFSLFCGWSTEIIITFGNDDRVRRVHEGQPTQTCM